MRHRWCLTGLVLLCFGTARGGIEFETIYRALPEGGGVAQVLPAEVAEARGVLAVYPYGIYWMGGSFDSDFGDFAFLRRANLDGGGLEDLSGPTAIGGIAIDAMASKLYLTPQSDCAPGCTSIVRTDLDAGDDAELLFPAGFPESIAIDPSVELVCWFDLFLGDDFEEGIACGLVGDAEGQIRVADVARGIAVDTINAKLYWVRSDRIRRSNLDGSFIEDLIVDLDDAFGIALDPGGNRMWWTECSPGQIRRASLDGSDVQVVVRDLDMPTAIAFLDASGGPQDDRIYWLSRPGSVPVPATPTRGAVLLGLTLLTLSTLALHRRLRS